MASKPETTFYRGLHDHLPPPSQLYRMKLSNDYVAGVPDFWYSAQRDLWNEFKFLVLPKRDDTMLDFTDLKKGYCLSALQQDWITERQRQGRNVWVTVGSPEGGVVFTGQEWRTPMSTGDFRKAALSRRQIADLIADFVQGRVHADQLPAAVHDRASSHSGVSNRQHRTAALLSSPARPRRAKV